MPKPIESSKFVSHRGIILGKFDSKKDLHLAKFEQRPRIFVKLNFKELHGSRELSGYLVYILLIIWP